MLVLHHEVSDVFDPFLFCVSTLPSSVISETVGAQFIDAVVVDPDLFT